MKKSRFFVCGLTALILALVLAGCGANPKALAKQTYDLTQEAVASASNPLKLAGNAVKIANVQKKVDKLSAANRRIYDEELARLYGQGVAGLLDSPSGLSDLLGGILGTSGQTSNAPSGGGRKEIDAYFKDFEKYVTKLEKQKNKTTIALSSFELLGFMTKATSFEESDSWTDTDSKKAEALYTRATAVFEKLD